MSLKATIIATCDQCGQFVVTTVTVDAEFEDINWATGIPNGWQLWFQPDNADGTSQPDKVFDTEACAAKWLRANGREDDAAALEAGEFYTLNHNVFPLEP